MFYFLLLKFVFIFHVLNRNVNTDIEPVYTFRKHESAVLSVLLTENGEHLISSDLNSKIIVWNVPNYETADQYDSYCKALFIFGF
jgi:WD40 repeat protein